MIFKIKHKDTGRIKEFAIDNSYVKQLNCPRGEFFIADVCETAIETRDNVLAVYCDYEVYYDIDGRTDNPKPPVHIWELTKWAIWNRKKQQWFIGGISKKYPSFAWSGLIDIARTYRNYSDAIMAVNTIDEDCHPVEFTLKCNPKTLGKPNVDS